MATITSLKFDISSRWDGAAIRQAQGDLKLLNQDLRRLNNTRIQVQVDVDDSVARQQLRRLDNDTRNRSLVLNVDADTGAAETQIDYAARDRRATIEIDVDRNILGQISNDFDSVGRSASNAGYQAEHMGRMAKIGIAVFAASLVALPGLINVVGGTMMAVLPAAFVAVAAVANKENASIVASFERIKTEGMDIVRQASAPMVDEIVAGLDDIMFHLRDLEPTFERAFAAAAPAIAPMIDTLTHFVENSMPGVNKALENIMPVMRHMQVAGENLGTSMSNMFAAMADGADGLGMALEVTFTHIGVMMQRFGEAARDMSQTGTFVWGELLSGFNDLIDGILDGLTGFTAAASGPFGIFIHTFGDQLGGLFRDILPALGKVVSALSEALTPILERLTPVVGQLAASFLESLVPVIDALAPIAIALADGFATILEWIEPMMPVLGPLAAAWWVLNAAMAANPMVLLVTAAVALASGIVYLATRTQFFQNIWNASWGFIKDVASSVWQYLQMRWDQFVQTFVDVWHRSRDFVIAVWDFIKMRWEQFIGTLTNAWNAVSGALSAAWNAVWGNIRATFDAVVNAIRFVWETGINTLMTVWNTIGNALRTAWEAVWLGIRYALAAVTTAIVAAWEFTVGRFLPVWQAIIGALQAAWNAVWGAIRDFVVGLWQGIQDKWSALWTDVQNKWNAFWGWLQGIWNTAWNWVRDLVTGVWNHLVTGWNELWDRVTEKWNAFWGWLQGIWNTAWNWVRDLFIGIRDHLVRGWNELWDRVTEKWNAFWGWLQGIWNTAWTWVHDLVTGIWDKIHGRWVNFTNTIQAVLQNVIDWIRAKWDEIWNWVSTKASDAWNWITGKFTEFKDSVTGTIQSLVDRVKEIWDGIVGIFQKPVEEVKKIWDGVAGIFGLKDGGEVSPQAVQARAYGGPIFGAGTTTSDSIPALLSNDEHVWTASEVRAAGGHRAVEKIRRGVLSRRGNPRDDNRFANGGIVGYAEGGALEYAKGIAREKGDGRAYVYGGTGPDGFDCSGYMSAIFNALTGRPLWQRSFSTESNFDGLGFRPGLSSRFAVGIMRGGGGPNSHMAGTLDGVNVESGGAHSSTRYGGPAQGADSGTFPIKYFLPEVGGEFISGGGGGRSGPSPEQIAAHRRAVDEIKRVIDDTNMQSATKAFGSGVERAKGKGFSGMRKQKVMKSGFGAYAPAGDVPAGGTHGVGKGAIAKLDAALASASAAIGGVIPEGERAAIIAEALRITNTPPPSTQDAWMRGMNTLITRESNWNAGAVNTYDSNARAGNASRGLAQVIPTTFEAHKAPGHNNIDAPVDNVAASVNYIKSRYGTIENVQQANANMPPKGYALGTSSARKGWNLVGENGPEMVRFSGGEQVKSFDDIVAAVKDSAIGNTNQIIDRFSTEINTAIDRIGGQHTDALERLVTQLSGEVKSFVAQAIDGQNASGEELAARLETTLRDFVNGALSQAGINMNMDVKLPNGASSSPQEIVNAVRDQLLPELERALLQQVGKRK